MERTQPGASSIRYADLDGLRAASMTLGLVYHALFPFTADTIGTFCHDSRAGLWADVAAAIPHGFRVEIFFLMAGFFARLVMVRAGPRGFANCARRVLRPLLFGAALLLPVMNGLMRYSRFLGLLPLQDYAPNWQPMPLYLWFLDYLVVLEVATLALVALTRSSPLTSPGMRVLDKGFAALIAHPLAPWFLAVPSAVMAFIASDRPYFSYVPHPSWLVYEGAFFFCGWLLHRQPELRLWLGKHWLFFLGLSALVFTARWWAAPQLPESADAYCGALYAWSMSLGLVGLFAQRMAKPNAVTWYLADASYWVYLSHWPVLTFLQLSTANVAWPGPLKVLLLIVIAATVSLLSYHYGVRYTALGVALHGERSRRPSFIPAVASTVSAGFELESMKTGSNPLSSDR